MHVQTSINEVNYYTYFNDCSKLEKSIPNFSQMVNYNELNPKKNKIKKNVKSFSKGQD